MEAKNAGRYRATKKAENISPIARKHWDTNTQVKPIQICLKSRAWAKVRKLAAAAAE
jgi:hypothetical protein